MNLINGNITLSKMKCPKGTALEPQSGIISNKKIWNERGFLEENGTRNSRKPVCTKCGR